MIFQIKSRHNDDVLFERELPAPAVAWPYAQQLGLAIERAVKANVSLTGALLEGANLTAADLTGAWLEGADLTGANLNGASLDRAMLTDATLTDATLINATLIGANLSSANLCRANLTAADLTGACMELADLTEANLSRANLTGAVFDNATFDGTKIADNITVNRIPIQIYGSDMEWPVTIWDQHMQVGCELHALYEWAAFNRDRIAKMGGADALRFWKAYGAALLAIATADGRGVPMKETT